MSWALVPVGSDLPEVSEIRIVMINNDELSENQKAVGNISSWDDFDFLVMTMKTLIPTGK